MGKFIFVLQIYGLYEDNTGLFTTGSFIVLVQKQKDQNMKKVFLEGTKTGVLFSISI